MGQMMFHSCEKCGHHELCRYEADMDLILKEMAKVTNKREASRFRFSIQCPDYYEKTYSVRKPK